MKFDHLMISFFACLTIVMNFLLGIALVKFLKMTGHVNLLSHFFCEIQFFYSVHYHPVFKTARKLLTEA